MARPRREPTQPKSAEEKAAVAARIEEAQRTYITVAERIAAFKAEYPNGVLGKIVQPYLETTEKGLTFVVYGAKAVPEPQTKPDWYGEGWAWEPVPGLTPYTRNSELQNAETAAWGRAIAALGFAVHDVEIATVEETRARDHERDSGVHLAPGGGAPLAEDREKLRALVVDLTELRERDWLAEVIAPWVEANTQGRQTVEDLNREQFLTLLDKVERIKERLVEEIEAEKPKDDEKEES